MAGENTSVAEVKPLKYEVRAQKESEPLAVFQYREWAEEWKHKMSRTGVIIERGQHVLLGGDRTDRMVPVQEDGGGTRLVNETELPDYPRDGEKPWLKGVLDDAVKTKQQWPQWAKSQNKE